MHKARVTLLPPIIFYYFYLKSSAGMVDCENKGICAYLLLDHGEQPQKSNIHSSN